MAGDAEPPHRAASDHAQVGLAVVADDGTLATANASMSGMLSHVPGLDADDFRIGYRSLARITSSRWSTSRWTSRSWTGSSRSVSRALRW